mmetsp:Transcript_102370/g.248854  ORF Transcript_102370/g.248854 Transcript_102370/m.248854 type:complete len:97 (-) Transcript_102370:1168-1458(-)
MIHAERKLRKYRFMLTGGIIVCSTLGFTVRILAKVAMQSPRKRPVMVDSVVHPERVPSLLPRPPVSPRGSVEPLPAAELQCLRWSRGAARTAGQSS